MYETEAGITQTQGLGLSRVGAAGMLDAAKRLPELPAALERQERALNGAADAISQLEMRLNPVLRAEPPQTAGNQINHAVRPSPSTQAASRVEENTDRVMALAAQLRSFLDRLEV